MKRVKMTRKRKIEAAKKDKDWKRKARGQALARELERVKIDEKRTQKARFKAMAAQIINHSTGRETA